MDDYADSTQAFRLIGSGGVIDLPLSEAPSDSALASARGEAAPAAAPVASVLLLKRLVDVVSSIVLLLLLSPLLLLVSSALLACGGPVVFAQARVGRHGRVFTCYKFRSMVPDAERVLTDLMRSSDELREEWSRSQKLRVDPRITGLGELLRRTSMDELPQLWNVLRGDMSLIGPRPVLPEQLAWYGTQAACYTSMRPGITGLWQVTARGDADFARRIELDCEYVHRFSLPLDLWILLRTVSVVLSGRGAY